jgi:hypothetical protein
MGSARSNDSGSSTRTAGTRLVEVREPDFLALLFGARAMFVRKETGSDERFALMLVEVKGGGYMMMGDAPKSVFVENRSDVERWRCRQGFSENGHTTR